ncbi:MAG TPA: 4-(cytidine 5'-diphospho)-2-C-methyl-D-erythritol kinase [Chryseolinea sp.]|nr:4-(cytidine 5'-diphospho)-2-C-methyl-D-erythritol kinase [Chryseolinea sp.]
MVSFPPCKINLGLNILNKRPDGYHNLETCFYPVPWTDILEIIPGETLTFSSSGNSIPGKADENLCLKAYHLLRNDYSLDPVKIHLHKMIPTGAGLGGGSSDAAHTLRLLNSIFQLNISKEKLMHYASKLGSDCAFFIQDKPMFGSGRGEVLTTVDISLKGKFLILVKPDIHVSTLDAYSNVNPCQPEVSLQNTLMTNPVSRWKDVVRNDFEESVFKKFPEIQSIKEKMYSLGAVYASMSGSGSTVFGIFDLPITDNAFPGLVQWSAGLN